MADSMMLEKRDGFSTVMGTGRGLQVGQKSSLDTRGSHLLIHPHGPYANIVKSYAFDNLARMTGDEATKAFAVWRYYPSVHVKMLKAEDALEKAARGLRPDSCSQEIWERFGEGRHIPQIQTNIKEAVLQQCPLAYSLIPVENAALAVAFLPLLSNEQAQGLMACWSIAFGYAQDFTPLSQEPLENFKLID